MEPLDPAKNDESSGFSKRRISSVECAKPAEKRNSRRVSFAPANDVLLFSKDVKNASPARSPLQELVNFDTGGDFGEKTVMFSTDDAFMDMTHSHTINIANDAELLADVSPQNGVLPTSEEKTVMFTVDDGSMDMTLNHTLSMTSRSFSLPAGRNMDLSVEKISSSVPCLDPEFENFLASLSKPGDPSINPALTKVTPPAGNSSEDANGSLAQTKTQTCDVDKENQAPASVLALMEKSLTTSRRTGDSSCRSALCPEDKDDDDEDAFQCLFPTQEMYLQAAETAKQQQSSTTPASVSPQDTTSFKNLPQHHQTVKVNLDKKDGCREKTILFTAGDEFMDMTQSHTIKFDAEDDCREKTLRFSADDAAMDVTQSHTVNIATNLELQSQQNLDFLPISGEKTLRFTANDAAMDMTQCLTVNIASNLASDSVPLVKKQEGGTCGLSRNRSSSAHGLDPGFNNLLTSLSKPSVNPVIARMMPTAAQSSITRHSSSGSTSCPEDGVSMDMTEVGHNFGGDVSMDITEAQLGHILEVTGTDVPKIANLKKAQITSPEHYIEALGSSYPKGMETSLTASVKAKVQRHQVRFDAEDNCREKTVRFTADDACMDVTRSHTVNIATVFEPQSHHSLDFLPSCGEKTVRFSANDAAMDVTRSHTVNISTVFKPQSQQNVDFLPACGEKTVRFSANDAAMDVTRSHTVNIATVVKPQTHQNVDFLPACGEKTVRFTANDAAMDVTRSHTVNISTGFEPPSHKNGDVLPAYSEKTVRFTANDAAMDVTQSHTVNIASSSVSDSVLSPQDSNIVSTHENMDFPLSAKKRESEVGRLRRSQSSSAQTLDAGLKNSSSKTSGLWANPVITKSVVPAALSPQESDTSGFLEQLKTQMPEAKTEKAPGSVSSVMENSVNKTTTDCPENDVNMDMTEVQTGHIFGQTCIDEPPQCLFSTQELYPKSDHLKETEATSQLSNGTPGLSKPHSVEMTNCPGFLDSNEKDTRKEPEPRNQTCSPSAVDHDVDAAPSRKSRRISLADLHSKVRRLSHMINTAPDTIAMDSCTAPLPELEYAMDKNAKDKTKIPPVVEPELEMDLGNTEENTAQCLVQEHPSTTTTPFKLKTKQLMSRLSMGGFKPKLPRRSKPDDPKKVDSLGEHTRTVTVNVTNQLSNFDGDVSDIYDEELGSLEDMSETLDTRSPQKATEKQSPSQEFKMDEPLEDDVFRRDFISAVHGKRRPLPEDENNMEDEKRIKTSTEIDFEAKLDEGTITVLEFFKLFNIDFVIHNPRQSVLPGRLLSDTDRTPLDVLKDRHITRPKQMVYETNVLDLTEKVEGLKQRMQDLDKPLRIVNRPLWEEMRNSSEKELKSFGAKLKERNNFFRKTSKVQSHEMKEVLYSNLVQANLEEQQKLRGTIEEADEMIKSLDDCISELETELAAVEEKGSENTPSLKKRQEEMQKVTEALANNERQISELEMQKKQSTNKLNRLKAETRNLESHITMLHIVNEWKLGEKRDNCTLYTFLHETFHLQLVYEKSSGNDADDQSEGKILQITFKFQLDDGKSQDHACLVHKLLSQYIEGESAWVEKYPTSRHVPKLLHDVGLVVSRCRLLGEELRLLKMWGSLRLDILSISCVDTRVHIVFSSLKKFSKFEVVFSVSLANHLCVLQVHNFKNLIGSTTIQQIEEIVASFSPAKNVLTKIIKKIHENLLC
ncbi:hypothetical protein L3Q82_001283 [Scortum barcoo]|uniref:Uncharacterized protein n=1 Tax=Scortum barcoo TaxID=214431 RepID=A0ACB8W797_9TELE|nr:hypothetical protein L3Q82_001283 [Scortum barcoo]